MKKYSMSPKGIVWNLCLSTMYGSCNDESALLLLVFRVFFVAVHLHLSEPQAPRVERLRRAILRTE